MTGDLTPDAMTSLLSVVLEVLREQDRPIDVITIHTCGQIEIRLDPNGPGQRANPLDAWRAEKRRRRRSQDST